MSAEVIIPWRDGCEYRREAFDWVLDRHEHPVRVGEGGDPWIKADAVMPAIKASRADFIILADADCWTDGIPDALAALEDGAPWAIPHLQVLRLDALGSRRYMGAESHEELSLAQRPYRGYAGGGFVVAPRRTLLQIPLDPRFIGWGHEDECLALALTRLAGQPWRGSKPLYHFWHPPQPRPNRRYGSKESRALLGRYVRAARNPGRMRDLLKEINHARWESDHPPMQDPSPRAGRGRRVRQRH